MAVSFAPAPRVHDSPSQPYYPTYSLYTNGEPSPQDSQAGTPSSYSPNNTRAGYDHLPPHLAYQSRQLRPPRIPTYVPAVLRPTERPNRCSPPKAAQKRISRPGSGPLTPPSSAGNSFEETVDEDEDDEEVLRRVLEDGMAQSGISRIVTDEWKNRPVEDVTGLPTRDHWKPDEASDNCDHAPCAASFTTFRRRHHCRRCGKIFCSTHVAHEVPLDQHARFHPDGAQGRACVSCWKDFRYWDKARHLRAAGSLGSSKNTSCDGTGAVTPTVAVPGVSDGKSNESDKDHESTKSASPSDDPGNIIEDAVAVAANQDAGEKHKQQQQGPNAHSRGKFDGTGRGSGEMASSYATYWNWSTF